MMKMSADMEADIQAAEDRGEPVSLMEPLLIGDGSRKRGGGRRSFRRSLPAGLVLTINRA
jgi:hypothetical protein